MDKNLLKRECDFYKLNEELESRAQDLFKLVENVMREKESFSDPLEIITTISTTSTPQTSPGFPTNIRSAKAVFASDGTERPEFEGEIRPQAALHLLQVQYKVIEKEKATLQVEVKAQNEKLKKSRNELQKVQEDHNKLQQHSEMLQKNNKKQQQQIQEMANLLAIKDTDVKSLRKELDALTRQTKLTCQDKASDKVKLNRCQEEIERLKSALKSADCDEREGKEATRRENLQLRANIQSLEKQKADLMFGVKKQYLLIDNLKQQMLQTSVSRFVQYSEEEFSRILDDKMEVPTGKPATQKPTKKN